jgi:hypothetical protein
MHLPEFTADASLYRTGAKYRGYATGTNGPTANSVEAQSLNRGWSWWCPPPLCGRDEFGQCHCLSVIGGSSLIQ